MRNFLTHLKVFSFKICQKLKICSFLYNKLTEAFFCSLYMSAQFCTKT